MLPQVATWTLQAHFSMANPGARATPAIVKATTARSQGMMIEIRSATAREPYPLDRVVCPVLTISAEDDAFGTAARAREIAASVRSGRAIIFPSGGHALVGHYADTDCRRAGPARRAAASPPRPVVP